MNVAVALLAAAVAAADPEAVFRDPPSSAKVGVWWHWMGSAVTREGIVRDLDWMRSCIFKREMGKIKIELGNWTDRALAAG